MKKDKILKDKKFLKEIAIILIVGIIVNGACFLMGTIHSHAMTSIYQLPYNLANFQSINQPFSQYTNDILTAISNSNFVNNGTYFQDDHYFIYLDTVGSSTVYFYICSNVRFDDTSNIVTFSNNTITCRANTDKSTIRVKADNNNGVLSNFEVVGYRNSGNSWSLLGNATLRSGYGFDDYRYTYPFVIVGDFYDINNNLVLTNTSVNSGNTTQFENAELTGHATNNTQPTTPTITAPAIDSSLSVIENVKILFNWLGETIKSLLSWLLSSILSFFDNLVNNIKAFIDAVIRAINNGFMNIYNNIQSLFYPFITFFTGYAQGMQDFIDEITDSQTGIIPFIKLQIANIRTGIASLVDDVFSIKNFLTGAQGFFETYGVIWNQETWEDALDNSPWLDAVSDNTTTMSQFINGTLNVAEPQELSFTMDFRNAYYNFGLVTWDLSWYQPYKQPVRLAFLSICVLHALVYFFDEAPNFFSGGGSNKKGDK